MWGEGSDLRDGGLDSSCGRVFAVTSVFGIAVVGDGEEGAELLLLSLKALRQRSAAYRTPAAIHEVRTCLSPPRHPAATLDRGPKI